MEVFVTLSDNTQCKIISIGKIGNGFSSIKKVSLVDGLKHNLLSISQLCDKVFKVIFEPSHCIVQDSNINKVSFIVRRIDIDNVSTTLVKCITSLSDESWLWHRRLDYVNMCLTFNLTNNNLVMVFSKINFEKNRPCDACQKGKQVKFSFQSLSVVSTSRLLSYFIWIFLAPPKS